MKKLTKFLYKYRFWLVLAVALATRILLLNGSIDFFDSMQYVWRSDVGSLKDALTSGHAPYHPGYIFFTYNINQIFQALNINNIPLAAALPSAIFGSLTILVFYAWAEKMFNVKTALLSAVLLAIIPYFWISNISIIVDPTMIFFYILSLFLFYLWCKEEKYLWLMLSGFSFGMSLWAHTQIAFWALGFVGIFIAFVSFKKMPVKLLKSVPWLIGPAIFIFIYLYLLTTSGHNQTYSEALKYLLGGNAGDHMPWSLVPGIRNYTIILSLYIAALSIAGLVKMLIEKTKEGLFLIIWLVPGLFVSALYLYANLYGRSSMICIFPAIIAVSYLFCYWQSKNKIVKAVKYILIILAIGQLLYLSIPIIKLYATEPAPYQELDKIRKELEPGGVAILSKLEKTLAGYENYVVVEEMPKTKIDAAIKKALDNNKPIYIDADAIRYPYFQYDGHNWEIQSTKRGEPGKNESILAYLFSDFNFDLTKTSRYENKTSIYEAYKNDNNFKNRLEDNIKSLGNGQALIMGKITDKNLQKPVSRLVVDIYSKEIPISRQKINYHDILYWLYNNWQKNDDKSIEPINWAYTDKNGIFSVPISQKELKNSLEIYTNSFNLSTNDAIRDISESIKFIKAQTTDLLKNSIDKKEGTININELSKLSEELEKSETFYLIIEKIDSGKIYYQYVPSEYELELTDTISAKSLAHDTKFLTFGPWITLPKGKYQIIYQMKISDTDDRDEIGYLEVSAENKENPLTQKSLRVSDFKAENEYQDITLEFESGGDTGVEFRTKSNGAVGIEVESIKLNKQ